MNVMKRNCCPNNQYIKLKRFEVVVVHFESDGIVEAA
jgi:hypothetical protein